MDGVDTRRRDAQQSTLEHYSSLPSHPRDIVERERKRDSGVVAQHRSIVAAKDADKRAPKRRIAALLCLQSLIRECISRRGELPRRTMFSLCAQQESREAFQRTAPQMMPTATFHSATTTTTTTSNFTRRQRA